jgi:hypothetical protein
MLECRGLLCQLIVALPISPTCFLESIAPALQPADIGRAFSARGLGSHIQSLDLGVELLWSRNWFVHRITVTFLRGCWGCACLPAICARIRASTFATSSGVAVLIKSSKSGVGSTSIAKAGSSGAIYVSASAKSACISSSEKRLSIRSRVCCRW